MTPSSDGLWRIRVRCGDRVGAGFVVEGGFVLTCAHVVQGTAEPVIELPGTEKKWKGRIHFYDKSWHEVQKPWADVAVVALPDGVALDPAPLGPLTPQYQRGAVLEVFGFPLSYRRHEDRGQRAEVQVAGRAQSEKLLQVDRVSRYGGRIDKGFSGSAATDERSGRVVGMVTQADRDPDAGISWIIPLETISESWSDLLKYLPAAFAADPDVDRAIQDLRHGRYGDALTRLNELIHLYLNETDMYYYRALAGLAGIRPGRYSMEMILAVEELLRYAWDRAQPSERPPHIGALWALVREDYYVYRGIREPSPSRDELRYAFQKLKLSDQHCRELWQHVRAPGCPTWHELDDRLNQGAKNYE